MIYAPKGFAHRFQALEDGTEMFYRMSESYHPEHAWGVRWDDSALAIPWPVAKPRVSPRDLAHPLLQTLPPETLG